ncbi:MAG: ATP-binding cassette domain-containing protein [Candidatus Hermodarchaeota archaeon]
MEIIILENVSYYLASLNRFILTDVNFVVNEGDFVTVKGPSGSGKTTLLHICGSLLFPTSGTAKIFGLYSSDSTALQIRPKIGYVFQTSILLEHLTVKENFSILARWAGIDKSQTERDGVELLTKFDLIDYFNQIPLKMSLGQRQRIALIIPMLLKPRLILMDEPLGSIDFKLRNLIINQIKLMKEEGTTMVVVTHDLSMDKMSDVIYNLVDGSLK